MFTEEKQLIDKRLNALIPVSELPNKSLYTAARYSLLNDAKRIRPILVLLVCKSYGIPYDIALDVACGLEMVHTYSLIHDDLPCMDDDDLRRGKPTLHKAFSEAEAVLAGDYLLTKAFEVIAKAPHLTSDKKLELINCLSERAGGEGMIGGQVIDLKSEGKKISFKLLKLMHKKKTAALISCALEFGSIIADASSNEKKMLKQFGEYIGLDFQIIDDVLDITVSEDDLGKTAASDLSQNKSTYPSILGLKEAKHHASELLIASEKILQSLVVDTTCLRDISRYILERNH